MLSWAWGCAVLAVARVDVHDSPSCTGTSAALVKYLVSPIPHTPAPRTRAPPAPSTPQRYNGLPGPCQRLRLNDEPVPFETAVFKGTVLVLVRHLPTTPNSCFKGKKRLTWFVIQVWWGLEGRRGPQQQVGRCLLGWARALGREGGREGRCLYSLH